MVTLVLLNKKHKQNGVEGKMAKKIDPSLNSISEFLNLEEKKYFFIPEYQRSYSWDLTQCDKLWQDIESFISSGASDPYFFGTIIVDCSNTEKTNKLSLIDGQQRTTTFLLLLKALLLRINETLLKITADDDSAPLKAGLEANRNMIMGVLYKADPEDIPSMIYDFRKTHDILILENKSNNELYKDEVKKIIEANDFETAERNVHKIAFRKKDNKYTNHFRNFKLFYENLKAKSQTELNTFAKVFLKKCQVIEIRSWQIEQAIMMFNSLNSTGLPLSDADIISAQLYSNSGESKVKFNEEWKRINEKTNELNNRKITDIVGVLQQFMYINRSINKEVDVTTPGLRRYYIDIQKDLMSEPLVLCNKLHKIAERWDKIKDLPIVKLLLKGNENVKLFLSSYLYRYEESEITENSIIEVCESLLRLFILLELSDVGYSSSLFKTFLFKENIKLVDKNVSINTVKNDFDEHIKKHWIDKEKENDVEDAILEYDKNLLVYLNEYLYSKNKGQKFDFVESVNVEHIMPASGRNIATIQQDAGIANIEEFNDVVNKLGNKILLEEDINKSIGNEWFKTKKQTSIHDKSGYKDSKFSIAKDLTSYPKDLWTKEDIDKATEKAAKRIVKFIFNKQDE